MEYPYFSHTASSYTSSAASPPARSSAPLGNMGEPYDRQAQTPQQPYGAYAAYPGVEASSVAAGVPIPTTREHRGSMARTDSIGADPDRDRRSSSDEPETLTPAQARRKAQNRAAQRAFRERKERHVKDLEQRVATLEQASSSLAADNERLRRALDQATSENQRLRATLLGPRSSPAEVAAASASLMRTPPAAFYDTTPAHSPQPRTGERLVSTNAAWDLIHHHPLTTQGLVNVSAVADRLKEKVRYDGTSPAFEERDVMAAIEASLVSDQDALG